MNELKRQIIKIVLLVGSNVTLTEFLSEVEKLKKLIDKTSPVDLALMAEQLELAEA